MFDLMLDTGKLSPVEAARAIVARVENGPPGDAVKRLPDKLGIQAL